MTTLGMLLQGAAFALVLCVLPLGARAQAPTTQDSCSAQQRTFTTAEAREDLELAISAAEAALPDIHWHQTPDEWKAAKERARSSIAAGQAGDAFLRTVRILLYQIGEGHMSVRGTAITSCRARASAVFPLDILWRDDGMFVIATYGDTEGIAKGSEILSINGQSHTELLDEMFQASPHDGKIRTGVMRDQGSDYAAMRWLLRGEESGFHLRLKDLDGKIREVDVHPVPFSARPKPPADPPPVAQLRWVDEKTAYLYVPTFSNKRYRAAGADYASTIHAHFEQLRAKGAERLVLDLRDNGGGSEPNEKILFSYLVEQPVQEYAYVRSRANDLEVTSLSGRVYREKIYDTSELSTVRKVGEYLERLNIQPMGLMTHWSPSSPVFKGKLAVLAGGATFSGGAELSSLLYASRRAVFVGEEVGGTHAGNTSGYKWWITLPNSGIEIGIPLLKFRFVWDDEPRDRGVPPNCKIQPTVWDIRVANDNAYRAALAILAEPWTQPRGLGCPRSSSTGSGTRTP